MHRASAQRTCVDAPCENSGKMHPPQHRKSKGDVCMCGRQRNPAQRNRLCGMIFIQSSRKSGLRKIYQSVNRCLSAKSQIYLKSVVRCNPKPHQQNRPLFVMESSRTHGHHAARRLQLCAARSSLFVSGQRSHRHTTCRPRRRSRPGKPLLKSKHSSLKIHLSNPSIHPPRLPRFRRSRLFQKHL